MCKYLNAYAKYQSTNREIKTAKCLLSNEIAKFSSAKFYRVKFSSAKFSRPTVVVQGTSRDPVLCSSCSQGKLVLLYVF